MYVKILSVRVIKFDRKYRESYIGDSGYLIEVKFSMDN